MYYDFKNKSVGSALFNLKADSLKPGQVASLSDPFIDGPPCIFLRHGKTIYKLINRKWEQTDRLFLLQNSHYTFSNHEVGERNYVIVHTLKPTNHIVN